MQQRILAKLFCSDNKQFLYDTNNNSILELSPDAFAAVQQYMYNQEITNQYVSALKEKGFLKSRIITRIEHPYTNVASIIVNRHVMSITLQVTQNCNFRCRYCSYAFNSGFSRTHNKESMTWETAHKAIDYLIKHSVDANEVNISFYGGEPLLNFDIIKGVVLYVKENMQHKRIVFSMTTNFYCVSQEILRFLSDNRFLLLISLDGPAEIHNKHRKLASDGSGTFSKVFENVVRLKNEFPDYFYECVQFNPVVFDDEEYKIVFDFYKKSLDVSRNRVQLQRVDDSGISLDFDYLPTKERTENNSYHTTMLHDYFNTILAEKSKISSVYHINGSCVPGADKLFVSTSGKLFPCEKVNELSECMCIGSLESGVNVQKIQYLMNIGNLLEFDCAECWAIRFCKICCVNCDSGSSSLCTDMKINKCQHMKNEVLEYLKTKAKEKSRS